MPQHTRTPASLSYDDYKGWIRLEVLKWLGDHTGDSDYPSHIVGGLVNFTANIDAYDAAYSPYVNLIELAHARNKLYSTASENLAEKLQQIKYALPTIAPDPEILALFNLAGNIPTDRDKIQIVAENALTYWATVAADPLFAPVVGDFTTLQTLLDDFISAQANFIGTDDQREATQNLVLSTREAIHEIERKVFNWYRSRHPKGDDEWWTNTSWGRTGGGSSEPGGGELPKIPDAPTGLTVVLKMSPSPFMLISCDPYGEHSGFDILRAETAAGVTEPPIMPGELFIQNTLLPLMDGEIMPGMKYWYQIRARNGEEVGDWTEIVGEEYK